MKTNTKMRIIRAIALRDVLPDAKKDFRDLAESDNLEIKEIKTGYKNPLLISNILIYRTIFLGKMKKGNVKDGKI